MIAQIGHVAGQIWRILGENDKVEVSKIPELLKQKTSIVYQGLGWLARENKINYHNQDNKMYVSLVDTEREVFKSMIA